MSNSPPDDRAPEMEPCPHCGGVAVHHTNVEQRRPEDWRYWVGCNKILCVSGPVCETKEAAIVAWNRLGSGGAALDAAEAENERLRTGIKEALYEYDYGGPHYDALGSVMAAPLRAALGREGEQG